MPLSSRYKILNDVEIKLIYSICNTQVFEAWMPVMPSSTIPGKVLLWDITELSRSQAYKSTVAYNNWSIDQVLKIKHKQRKYVVEPFVNATGNADDGRRA